MSFENLFEVKKKLSNDFSINVGRCEDHGATLNGLFYSEVVI